MRPAARTENAMQTPPTDEETAAILTAVEVLWPKPVAVPTAPARRHTPWRFSGRWWNGPAPVRRARPRF
jgi:hypothetical protein